MKTATYTQANNAVAGFSKMSFAAIMIFSSVFFSGCSNDESSPLAASADGKDDVSEKVAMPKTIPDEPTIEITGKASFDIWGLNNQIGSDVGKHALAKTASSVMVENLGLEGPYSDIARKLLEQGEKGVDAYFDKYTAGVWSIAKSTLLDWAFPSKKNTFDIADAFEKVDAQFANLEAILSEMRVEVENEMKVQTYSQRLNEREELYTALRHGLNELWNRIALIDTSSKYPTEEDKYDALVEAVRTWGDSPSKNAVTRQQAAILLDRIITPTSSLGAKRYATTYLDIYDEYANRTLVWEQEGYNWRELMRAQDAKMVTSLATASILYYTIVTENPGEIKDIRKAMSEYKDVLGRKAVKRSSTINYIKYGSKWAGLKFTGELRDMNYQKMMSEWLFPHPWELVPMYSTEAYLMNRTWNMSRLYAGFGPKAKPKGEKRKFMKEAEELAMPEEWYKEVKEAYDVITPSGKQGRSLMEIFHSVGFTGGDAGDYVRDKNEQYFVTNRYPCFGRTFNGSDGSWRSGYSKQKPYRLSVTSVLGNTRGNIAVFDKESDREKEHQVFVAAYYEWNSGEFDILVPVNMGGYGWGDDYGYSYRHFYVPVKAPEVLVATALKAK